MSIKKLLKISITLLVVGCNLSCEPFTTVEDQLNFKVEDGQMHYVLLSFDKPEANIKEAKTKISDYNKTYHKANPIRITDIYLNPESKSKIILVRRFSNKADAMDYIVGAQNSNEFISKKEFDYEIFAATQHNYREVIKMKSIDSYQEFYKAKYLK